MNGERSPWRAVRGVACLVLILASACTTAEQAGWQAWHEGDFAGARAAWEPLADGGDAQAQFLMGVIHDEGRSVPVDHRLAARWYTRAADLGHPAAQNNLGLMFYEGRGVERSYEQAARLFERASKQGFVPGTCNLGIVCLMGQGVARDVSRAQRLLRRAADLGDGKAQYVLGAMSDLDSGHAATPETAPSEMAPSEMAPSEIAADMYRRAAENGEVLAQYRLGLQLLQMPRRDDHQAYHWLQAAADQGHAGAQCAVGLAYLRGTGVQSDDAMAFEWLRRAAIQGMPLAQYDLALLFTKGRGTARDYVAAVEWLQRAAKGGLPAAMARLGLMFEHGRGVAPDPVVACQWYTLAVQNGYEGATLERSRLQASLCDEDIARAEQLATLWRIATTPGDDLPQVPAGLAAPMR